MPFQKGVSPYLSRPLKAYNCVVCGTEFLSRHGRVKYCSKPCHGKKIDVYATTRRKSSLEGNLEKIVAGCRHRAKRRNLSCDIDTKYMLELLEKQQGLCAKTGIPLVPSNKNTRHHTHPHTISIDRIDNEKGYTKDNVELVTVMYNTAKNNWTHSDLIELAEGILKLSRS